MTSNAWRSTCHGSPRGWRRWASDRLTRSSTTCAAIEELQVAQEELLVAKEELNATNAVIDLERLRYRRLFEEAPDAHLVTDALGVILEANGQAGRLLGRPAQRLLGKPLATYAAPDDRREFRGRLRELRSADRIEGVALTLCLDDAPDLAVRATATALRAALQPSLGWLLRPAGPRDEVQVLALRR